ncbi:TIGR00730 family Rossman fold protein [Clostridium tyrobutyricum]|uniref:LOG family protein n=1 Tax=Clostridium tyrobutyricum TaxID=1519 RepID=UPI001C3806FF|nr:TIGR00730 family Rossman fold protein [Clostridium tyrobutyricum]MBV4418181.1 TIGR00730 family Rossman fold protein [Clostridium tyrobutyricum]
MRRICVYSGSSFGINKKYSKFARLLGKELVKNNIDLVYGGSKTGLMGEISDEVFKNNGNVIGIIPQIPLLEEKTSKTLTKLIKVKNMSERKEKMADLSDGFIALPGGLGTYEELFDTLSWARIGIHHKPIGLLNISNYFDSLIYMLENSYKEGFISKASMKLLLISDNPCELINSMKISCKQQIEIRKS